MSLESGCELAGPSGSLSLPKLPPKCHPGLQPSHGSTGKGFTSKYNCNCVNSWTKGLSISPILIRGPEGNVAAQHTSSQQQATRAGQRVGATNWMSVIYNLVSKWHLITSAIVSSLDTSHYTQTHTQGKVITLGLDTRMWGSE